MNEVCTRGVDTGFVALGYAKVAILGVVQGITELMPISSTAHMRLVPAVLGWQDPGSAFSAAMQLAALAAVVSYFWNDVRSLAVGSLKAAIRGRFRDHDLRFSVWIILATVPIGIAGLLLSTLLNTCNSPLRHIKVIGWACVVLALLLAITEVLARHRRTIENASLLDATLVGVAHDRRSYSRRLTVRLDAYRRACAWVSAGRGGALVISAWIAGNCVGGPKGNLGAS